MNMTQSNTHTHKTSVQIYNVRALCHQIEPPMLCHGDEKARERERHQKWPAAHKTYELAGIFKVRKQISLLFVPHLHVLVRELVHEEVRTFNGSVEYVSDAKFVKLLQIRCVPFT